MTEPVVIEQAPSAVLQTNTLCAECGYNLRGLPSDSICPECAHPIAKSLKVNLHPLGTGHDLRHLWWGLLAAGVAYLVWLLVMAGWGLQDGGFERTIFILAGLSGPTPWISAILTVEPPPRKSEFWILARGLITIAQLGWVVGIWVATINPKLRWRRGVSVVLLRFALVAGVVCCYVIAFNIRRFRTYPVFPITCVLLNLAAVIGTALWLGRIAGMAKMRWLKGTCVALAAATLGAQLLMVLAYWRSFGFQTLYAFAATAAVGLAQFVVLILLLLRVWRHWRIREQTDRVAEL